MNEETPNSQRSETERSLRESQRRLATLLSNLPGLAYRCKNDKDWTMEFVSDGCDALTGYKASEFIGIGARTYNSIIHPDDRDRIWNEVQEALGRRRPYRLTYRIFPADGREKWVWEQGVGVYSGDELEALEGFITDITERKTAERTLQDAEAKYRNLFEGALEGMYRTSIEGKPITGNPALAKMLATIYSSGKLVDKAKAAEHLTSFFHACPASTDWRAQWLLSKLGDNAAQTGVAMALRAQLAGETDPERLKQYEVLWGLEFRTRSPNQHAALRQQVAKDLVRAESLNPKPDAKWLAFLKNGYKQSGASEATLKAMDDRILRDFPSSPAAYRVVSSQWEEHHKEPEDSKDTAAWLAYNRIYEEALKGWIRDFPDLPYLGRSSWFYTISNDFTISEKDGVAAMDRFLKASKDYEAPSSSGYIDAADFLVQHRWQPKRALSLLHEAQPLLAKELEAEAKDDNRSAEDSDSLENSQTYQKQNFVGLMLQAARLAGRPAEAEALRSSIEAPPPKSTKRQSNYWLNRARLAELEKRKADALAYYQKALQTRVAAPTPWQGRLQDDLTDEARALWTNTGGTEVAWAVWSTSGGAKPEELKEGRWEKPKKTLPAFELADLAGKTWKLQSLEGKSVLINLWATWCGPCNAELPHLQKLYETVKGRTDLQIITFNIDTDLGLVEPFMKEKGYNFPVLPAYSLVMGLLDGVGIPQNWVVDPQGTWRWTQLGFDGAPDFVEAMIQRLESVRKSE